LKVIVAIAIQCPAQQAADGLTAHRLAPRSAGHGSGKVRVAVGGEECVHPLMLGSGSNCTDLRAKRQSTLVRAVHQRQAQRISGVAQREIVSGSSGDLQRLINELERGVVGQQHLDGYP